VDDIRQIVDEVRYSPTEGKYKVYIIDEVHMLSTGAFNALLKTLEEPPAYVIFILATTEVHKIPITILSRCQRYDFRRITRDTITGRLRELSEREGIEAEEKALNYVAKAADGSMRDALSLYDQCIAFYFGQKLTYDMVLDVLGAVDIDIFHRLLDGILRQDITGIIELLEEVTIAGRELTQLITDFTWYLRNLLLLKTSDQADDLVDASTENMELLREMAKRCQEEMLMRDIRILSELSNQIKYASQKRVLTEIALIKMCRPQMESGGGQEALLARISALEQRMEQGVVRKEMVPDSAGERKTAAGTGGFAFGEQEPEKEKVLLPDAVPEELMAAAGQWRAVISQLKGGLKSMIGAARPSVGKDNQMLLVFQDSTAEGFVNTEEHLQEIEAAIEAIIQKKVRVATKLVAQGDSSSEFPDLRLLEKRIKMPIEIVD
jgi:DNA polymerase-3 subunit gamma/tau